MKRIFLLSIIAFMIVNLGLYAQEKTTQTDPKLRLKLVPVYEKTFQDTIIDVIFDTVTVSIERAKKMGWKKEAFNEEERVKGKATISYPKIVFVSRGKKIGYYAPATKRSSNTVKEIRFYDINGILLNTIEIGKQGREWIHISPNSKYILVSKIPTEYRPNYSGGELYDNNGNKVWEKEGSTPFAVSDEGYTVGANLDWQVPPQTGGSFYIYNPSGELIKTIENPDKKRSAPLFAKYTSDGEYAVLVFKGTTVPPTIITLIKKTGEIIWQKEFSEYRFSGREEELDISKGVGISGIFDLITSSSAKKIEDWKTYAFFIDWKGYLKWRFSLNTGGNRICIFSHDRSKVYISTTYGYLWCLDAKKGKIIWKHIEPWSPPYGIPKLIDKVPWFTEMYEIPQNIVVKGTYMDWNKGYWYSTMILVFDRKTGNEKMRSEYPQEKMMFAKCNGKIGLINITKSKLNIFKLEIGK